MAAMISPEDDVLDQLKDDPFIKSDNKKEYLR